ncbi:MAG: hypothetical protein CMO34_07840, partial [Verrucomicrobia bacterium]|nr:hypothetical protein [Verrucomicrobiota bacterium]
MGTVMSKRKKKKGKSFDTEKIRELESMEHTEAQEAALNMLEESTMRDISRLSASIEKATTSSKVSEIMWYSY